MTAQPPEESDHLTEQEITSYLAGARLGVPAARARQHCLVCAECREQLAWVLETTQPDPPIDQAPEFARLLQAGERAAHQAWRQQRVAQTPTVPVPPGKFAAKWATAVDWLTPPRLVWGALALLCLAVLPGWWWWQQTQGDRAVEQAMLSLRQSWTVSRPLEARVTGDLPPLPYVRVRGGSAAAPDKQDQFLAAEAGLKLAVARQDTPQARQALARLYLLKLDFAAAETQLQLVLKAEPKNAAAHADLAVLYYERGVAEQSVPLLLQASQADEKALALAPQLAEAWFNLALIHEQLLLFAQAQKDWERYLELDPNSKWADEARARLQKLRERAAWQPRQADQLVADLRVAFARNDDAVLRRMLEEHFTSVSELLAGALFDDYLAEKLAGGVTAALTQQQLLQRLAGLIEQTKGEAFYVDLVEAVTTAAAPRLLQLRAIRARLQQARTASGDYQDQQVMEHGQAALTAAERIGDVPHIEMALYEMARVYSADVETPLVARLRQRLLQLATQHRHMQMQARAWLTLANQFGAERNMSRWLAADLQALALARQIQDFGLIAAAQRDVGLAYADLGKQEQSLAALYATTQALSTDALLNKACATYTQFARSLATSELFAEALDYQLEALPYCQRWQPAAYPIALSRAENYAARAGRTGEFARLFQQMLAEMSRYNQNSQTLAVDLFLSQGDVLLQQQQFRRAETAFLTAGEKLGSLHNVYYQAAIQHGLAAAYLPQGKIDAAEQALNQSIQFLEDSRVTIKEAASRSNYLGNQINVYKAMIAFKYVTKNDPEQAFAFTEKGRNRELLELLKDARALAWEEQKQDLRLDRVTQPLSLQQVCASLPPGTQLLEYALTENRLFLWLLDREGWQHENVPISEAQLREKVAAYVKGLREMQPQAVLNTQAQDLYRLLVQPLAKQLKASGTLVIVPDGPLHALPFAALVEPRSQRYLIELHTLTICPSATILVELLARKKAGNSAPIQSVLAVSDPVLDRELFPELKRLPGAGAEVNALSALYPRVTRLTAAQATKEAFLRQASQFEVLHLATHSLANVREPLLSAIVLARGNEQPATPAESLLLAREIMQLRLPRTQLVVLSSCNSLVNQSTGYSGLGGLAQAFFCAGVPSVIGSLWEVNDESTTSLMTAFHHKWRTEALPLGQALQQAQLSLLHSAKEPWRHPLHWAAFYLSGAGTTT